MALEGFSNHMKMPDGLETITRVEQLISLMQKDSCSTTKSTAEVTQCWATVTSVLTATENVEYLRLFIDLGGLRHLDRWLQEAQRSKIDSSDKALEDLISSVLGALLKLPLDEKWLKECGIAETIKNFCSHKDTGIQRKAKILCGGLEKFTEMTTAKEKIENETDCNYGVDTIKTATVEELEQSNHENTNTCDVPSQGVLGEHCLKGGPSGCKLKTLISYSDGGSFVAVSNSNDQVPALRKNAGDGGSVGIKVPKHSLEDIPTARSSAESETSIWAGKSSRLIEGKEMGISSGKNQPKKTSADGSASVVMEILENKQLQIVPSSSCSNIIPSPVSSSNDVFQEACSEANSITVDKKSKEEYATKTGFLQMAEHGPLNYWKKIMKQEGEKQTDSCLSAQLIQGTSIPLLEKKVNLGRFSQDLESSRADDVTRFQDVNCCLGKNAEEKPIMTEKCDSPVQKWGRKNAQLMTERDVEMEFSCELDDALEVARRVAKEVEREVGIYREASGSSLSIEGENGKTMLLSNADSAEPKRSGYLKEASSRSELQSTCSMKEELDKDTSAGNQCSEVKDPSQKMSTKMAESESSMQEQESSQLTTVPEGRIETNARPLFPIFDLNQDIQTEEADLTEKSVTPRLYPTNASTVSAPIPVIPTCRGLSRLPTEPLQFEGELGWRGFAATSAFHPAICKTHDKEKAGSIKENDDFSKRFHGIDLNMADSGDESVVEQCIRNHMPGSSSVPSGNSSAEVNSKKAERRNIDLNLLSEYDENCPDLSSDWRIESKLHPGMNGVHSPSVSSSSRSYVRDFDLNHKPSSKEELDIHGPVPGIWPSKSGILDDRISSIVGPPTQFRSMNVKSDWWANLGSVQDSVHCHGGKESQYPTHPLFVVGSNILPPVEQMGRFFAAQPIMPYAQAPAFSHNGYRMGPPYPVPSVIYPSGVAPYVMDSRGAAMVPQILGPGTLSNLPRASYLDVSRTKGANDMGIMRPNLNSNAGVTSLQIEPQGGNVRNHFYSGNGNSLMEEQMNSLQQAAIAGPSMKRKEPECGWESHQARCSGQGSSLIGFLKPNLVVPGYFVRNLLSISLIMLYGSLSTSCFCANKLFVFPRVLCVTAYPNWVVLNNAVNVTHISILASMGATSVY
ncbi:hypothetical protein ACLOJK_001110 [Asimina triloba]